jgi:hypothetical protein
VILIISFREDYLHMTISAFLLFYSFLAWQAL